MPVVTIDPAAVERFELKTAPADPSNPDDVNGYVVIRPLPYGMKLKRRDKMSRMSMKASESNSDSGEIALESFNEWAVQYDFGYCIVDHNLTDQNGRKLDFTKAITFNFLDPKVGSEIERLINSLNEDESEESLEDFLKRSNTSSMTDSTDSQNTDSLNGTEKETQ
jgi:hypothetical protein